MRLWVNGLVAISVVAACSPVLAQLRPSSTTQPEPLAVPCDEAAAQKAQEVWAKYLGESIERMNSVGMKFRIIPPWKFIAGSPAGEGNEDGYGPGKQGQPERSPKVFFLGKTEVTQGQWLQVMGTTPWKEAPKSYVLPEGDNFPATYISWNDAQVFCNKLNEKEKQEAYRLPTEAEWDHACRAGTTTTFSFGDDPSQLGQFAWCGTNTKRIGEKYAHEVALKKPNPFGLFDMHGNVEEYCDRIYTADPNKEERPHPAKQGGFRVKAGGSWQQDLSVDGSDGSAYYCRSASRTWPVPSAKMVGAGFRVALSVSVK